MTTIKDYFVYGETALAAYSENLLNGTAGINVVSLKDAGMPTEEATKFDATWAVIEQSADLSNGFSAVLLQNRTT